MVIKKRRFFFVATFLIIAAITLVLFVGYFTREKTTEYDGTLVEMQMEDICSLT